MPTCWNCGVNTRHWNREDDKKGSIRLSCPNCHCHKSTIIETNRIGRPLPEGGQNGIKVLRSMPETLRVHY